LKFLDGVKMKFALQWFCCAVLFAVAATSANARSVDQSTADATTCRVYMGNENSDTKKQCEAALAKYRQRLANEPDSASAAALTELQSSLKHVDYAAAVKLLTAAKARGAGWAAYWLAKLYVDGRGAPQSLPNAAENYQFALDHGYPSAVADYVSLFRDGRLTPVGKVRAKTILDAELGRNNLNARYEAEELERLDALQRVYVTSVQWRPIKGSLTASGSCTMNRLKMTNRS
jgi:TPR repeat protein